MYQVQFSDGTIQDYSANYIAEAISLELRLMNNVDRDAAEAGDAWNKGKIRSFCCVLRQLVSRSQVFRALIFC